jgi:Tfp pilus assembly protein PilE
MQRRWGGGHLGREEDRGDEFGFTVAELLVVMTIILVLAGLVLTMSSYVHTKGARARAETEIAALSAALESYKADNGIYPRNSDTDALSAKTNTDATQTIYQKTSLFLYEQLSGDTNADRTPEATMYFTFKDNQLGPATGNVLFIKDPFSNSYGYSTAGQAGTAAGYNPTFDLWSTSSSTDPVQWTKNW